MTGRPDIVPIDPTDPTTPAADGDEQPTPRPTGVAFVRGGQFVAVNDTLAEVFGRPAVALAGTDASPLEPADGPAASGAAYEREIVRHDGARRILRLEATDVADGVAGGRIYVAIDVTTSRESTAAAESARALHDPITGLPNRRLLQDRLTFALARARRASTMVAVLLVDLDGLKAVNDAHGHAVGTDVLRITGERIQAALRTSDTVARLSGDEFVVVIDGLKRLEDVGEVPTKLLSVVSQPMRPNRPGEASGPELAVTCSIGVSLYPRDSIEPDALVRMADMAMYQAKAAGRARYVMHSMRGPADGPPIVS